MNATATVATLATAGISLCGALAGCNGDHVIATLRGGIGSDGGPTPFSTPVLVYGLRSDADVTHDPSLTADELEIYFVFRTDQLNDIWKSRRDSAQAAWVSSTPVAELSSAADDEDPDVSDDGLVMHFSSNRAGAGMRLYVSQRADRDQPWSPPQPETDLGTTSSDQSPSVDTSRLHMVFASFRDGTKYIHLFSASRDSAAAPWGNVAELTAITSTTQDADPALFADGLSLVFASRRAAQGNSSDLFITERADVNAPFTVTPLALTELNTPDFWEGEPWLSADGRHIFFASDRDGHSRIYEARR